MAIRVKHRRRWRRNRRIAVVIILILVAAGWGVGFIVFARSVSAIPWPKETRTEAIIVLTGGSLRLEAGLSLLSAGRGEKLFVSGVHRGVEVAELLRVSRQQPRALDCCIVLGYAADNTRGNARESASWMRKEGYGSMQLVTANYHMPRSLFEFRAAMPRVEIVPHPVFPKHVKLEAWWFAPGTVILLAREYAKLQLAWLRRAWQSLIVAVSGRPQ